MSGCALIFVEKSFTDCPKTTKLVKAFFLESVPLYGTYVRKARQVQRTRLCDRSKVYLQLVASIAMPCSVVDHLWHTSSVLISP